MCIHIFYVHLCTLCAAKILLFFDIRKDFRLFFISKIKFATIYITKSTAEAMLSIGLSLS